MNITKPEMKDEYNGGWRGGLILSCLVLVSNTAVRCSSMVLLDFSAGNQVCDGTHRSDVHIKPNCNSNYILSHIIIG